MTPVPSFVGLPAGAADGAHVHAQGDVLVDHDGPGITGIAPLLSWNP